MTAPGRSRGSAALVYTLTYSEGLRPWAKGPAVYLIDRRRVDCERERSGYASALPTGEEGVRLRPVSDCGSLPQPSSGFTIQHLLPPRVRARDGEVGIAPCGEVG